MFLTLGKRAAAINLWQHLDGSHKRHLSVSAWSVLCNAHAHDQITLHDIYRDAYMLHHDTEFWEKFTRLCVALDYTPDMFLSSLRDSHDAWLRIHPNTNCQYTETPETHNTCIT